MQILEMISASSMPTTKVPTALPPLTLQETLKARYIKPIIQQTSAALATATIKKMKASEGELDFRHSAGMELPGQIVGDTLKRFWQQNDAQEQGGPAGQRLGAENIHRPEGSSRNESSEKQKHETEAEPVQNSFEQKYPERDRRAYVGVQYAVGK